MQSAAVVDVDSPSAGAAATRKRCAFERIRDDVQRSRSSGTLGARRDVMLIHPVVPAFVVIAVVLATSGCARQEIMARPGESKLTAAPIPAPPPALVIASELRSKCDVHERDGAVFMKIVFDKSLLSSTDVGALEQLATCFTTGPMKGRTLTLNGRAAAPGERRANAAQGVLVSFGMPLANVTSTLRGGKNGAEKEPGGSQTDIDIDVEPLR